MHTDMLPQVALPEQMIHLGIGQPSNRLLPREAFEKAAARALSGTNRQFLAYGPEQGNLNFRETLAEFLTAHYPDPVDPGELLITNGNSQALEFICNRFTRPGDTLLVEEPSYFLALKIFSDHQLNLVSIPVDENGLLTDILEEKLKTVTPAFLYTIPTYHNPAGVTLSLERRKALVRICAKKNVMVVADEVYHFLNYSDIPPSPMSTWLTDCPMICLGSFSKILAPGLRLGWLQARPELLKRMTRAGLLVSGGGFNPFTSEIVNSVIGQGFLETHIQDLKSVYQDRIISFCQALKKYLPAGAQFAMPSGGYFIWVRFPNGLVTGNFKKAAQQQNVDFHPGELFSHNKELKNCLRLSFAFYETPHLIEGARRLGQAMTGLLAG